MKIELRTSVTTALRKEIKAHYFNAVAECGNEEIEYINLKIERVVKRLERSSSALEKDLAAYSCALYDLIIEETKFGFEEYHKDIVAALFYLCNPYDVIPDFNTQDGYLDDAIVVNICINEIRAKSNVSYIRLKQILGKGRFND